MKTQRSGQIAVAIVLIAFASVLVGFSTSPPMDLLQSNDHTQIAAWYEERAVELRQHAQAMRNMAKHYAKGKSTGMVMHCNNLVELFTRTAEENDALAKSHAGMAKGS